MSHKIARLTVAIVQVKQICELLLELPKRQKMILLLGLRLLMSMHRLILLRVLEPLTTYPQAGPLSRIKSWWFVILKDQYSYEPARLKRMVIEVVVDGKLVVKELSEPVADTATNALFLYRVR